MKKLKLCFLLILTGFSQSVFTQPIVVWNQLLTSRTPMVLDLLKQALQVTVDEYGPFQLISSKMMEQGRVIRQMANDGNVQIAIFAPNKEREESLIPVRIPVTGTLLGYRICLIRKGQQNLFTAITDLDSLIASNLTIGSHQNWPDTKIMQENGLTLWIANKYELLFTQLAAGKFDCFSRGADEILQELYSHPDKGLEIEQSLIIYYPLPLYYFVNKSNPELAERIAKGLNILNASGEYDKLFKEKFAEPLKILRIQDRKIIELTNPLLTEATKAQMQKDKERFKLLISKASL
jgi:hypothetical protein